MARSSIYTRYDHPNSGTGLCKWVDLTFQSAQSASIQIDDPLRYAVGHFVVRLSIKHPRGSTPFHTAADQISPL